MNSSKKVDIIYSRCKGAKVISFDIFGTLITRDVVNPNDVFGIVKKISYLQNIATDNVDDIRKMYEVEMSIVHPINYMVDLMRLLKRENKIIVLTSDMYLNGQMIINLLEKLGIIKGVDYDMILVSCDYNCTKRDRGLFKQLRKIYNIDYRDIVHIGDALRSDYISPSTLGINAIWMKHEKKGEFHVCRYNEINNLNRFISNHITDNSYEYMLGYKCFGPLLYGFTNWLDGLISEKNEQVFFLSREGYLFDKAMDIIGKKRKNMRYMLVSRRSIIGALLWKYEDVTGMVKSLGIDRKISFDKVTSLLNIRECLEEKGVSPRLKEKVYHNSDEIINDSESFSFITNHLTKIIDNSKKQYSAMEQYFESIGFNNAEDCVLVDIGWSGTMQHHLNEYLRLKNESKCIKGLYLGVHVKNYSEDAKEGFLFNGDSIRKQRDIFSFVGFLESVLSEQAGSVKHYDVRNGETIVERCNYEYNEKDEEKILLIQQGMLDFVKDMHNSVIKYGLDFDPYLSSYNLRRVGNYPLKADLDFYRKLEFLDDSYSLNSDFGLKKNSVREYKNKLVNSIWKTAFLKATFGNWFPAKLFYDCIYGLRRNG